jgi:hypothetical protein
LEVSLAAAPRHRKAADVTIVCEFMKLYYMPGDLKEFVLVL